MTVAQAVAFFSTSAAAPAAAAPSKARSADTVGSMLTYGLSLTQKQKEDLEKAIAKACQAHEKAQYPSKPFKAHRISISAVSSTDSSTPATNPSSSDTESDAKANASSGALAFFSKLLQRNPSPSSTAAEEAVKKMEDFKVRLKERKNNVVKIALEFKEFKNSWCRDVAGDDAVIRHSQLLADLCAQKLTDFEYAIASNEENRFFAIYQKIRRREENNLFCDQVDLYRVKPTGVRAQAIKVRFLDTTENSKTSINDPKKNSMQKTINIPDEEMDNLRNAIANGRKQGKTYVWEANMFDEAYTVVRKMLKPEFKEFCASDFFTVLLEWVGVSESEADAIYIPRGSFSAVEIRKT